MEEQTVWSSDCIRTSSNYDIDLVKLRGKFAIRSGSSPTLLQHGGVGHRIPVHASCHHIRGQDRQPVDHLAVLRPSVPLTHTPHFMITTDVLTKGVWVLGFGVWGLGFG